MKNNNILSATLLASALAISPAIALEVKTSTQAKTSVTSASIALILHKRGIDEDAALKISNKFTNENDDLLFAMINNLESGCNIVNKQEIMQYISSAALREEKVDLDNYAYLVGMVQAIKKRPLDAKTLKELQSIASRNTIYS